MDKNRLKLKPLILIATMLLSACSSYRQHNDMPRPASRTPMVSPAEKVQDSFAKENLKEMKKANETSTPKTPDFQPVSDDVSPAKSRLVNIQARNSALGDILHVIADAAGLNLIIGNGVEQDRAITITLKRVSAEDALNTILVSSDYFYTIKDNILSVETTGTKTFELGHPALVQNYNVDVGGDILGSALSAGGGGGSSNIRGTITKTVKSDTKAFDFWETLEKSLQSMIGKRETPTAKVETSTSSNRITASGVASNSQTKTVIERPQEAAVTRSSAENSSGTGAESGEPQQLIIINRLTGTIMVTATRKNLANIESYIETLKKSLNRQVIIEARVIEVQLSDVLKFGIDWEFLANIENVGLAAGGFGTVMSKGVSAAANSAAPAFRIGAMTSGSKGSLGTLITALQTQGEVKTLSNPRINVMNGQSALLTVGRNFNYISKVTSTTTAAAGSTPMVTYSVETGNVLSGMMIGLAPHINNRGEISLTVTPIVSHLVSLEDKKIGSDPANQTTISIPTVDLRELSTTVKVRNGELIIIGGLIQNKQNYKDEKVPFIGDIPWLGWLFARKDHTDERSELVVVLQPHLVNND